MAIICNPSGVELGGRTIMMGVHYEADTLTPPAWEITNTSAAWNVESAVNSIGSDLFYYPLAEYGPLAYVPRIGFAANGFRLPELDRIPDGWLGDPDTIDAIASARMILTLPSMTATTTTWEIVIVDPQSEEWDGPYDYYENEEGGDPVGQWWSRLTEDESYTGELQCCLVGFRERSVEGTARVIPEFIGGGGGSINVQQVQTSQAVDCTGLVKAYLKNRSKYIAFGLVFIPSSFSFEDYLGGLENPEAGLLTVEQAYHQSTFVWASGWADYVLAEIRFPLFTGTDTTALLTWNAPTIGIVAVSFDSSKMIFQTDSLLQYSAAPGREE